MSDRREAQDDAERFPRIVGTKGVLRGEPTVKGTRVSVRAIVVYHRMYRDIEPIQRAVPHLERAAIEEALRYYDAHHEEIDQYIAENEVDVS